jgi:hypothetical protein
MHFHVPVRTVPLSIDVDAAGDASEHPAPEPLFTAVAALCHLCDAHDADHVSPPPMGPMMLHAAMPEQLIGDDSESDPAACLQACFAAIKGGKSMLGLMAIRSALRILENLRRSGHSIQLTQLRAANSRQFEVERKETCDVLFHLIAPSVSSSPAFQREAALLLGDLSDFEASTDTFCDLARVSLNSPDKVLVESCLGAMCRMITRSRHCGAALITLGETELQKAFVDRLCVSIVEGASPNASALLVMMANCPPRSLVPSHQRCGAASSSSRHRSGNGPPTTTCGSWLQCSPAYVNWRTLA